MILISGVISIIFQKNTLCTNKIRMIYFCTNFVNFLAENVFLFLIFFFWGGEVGGDCPTVPPQLVRLLWGGHGPSAGHGSSWTFVWGPENGLCLFDFNV